jgi:hypothetical protein
MMFGGPVTVIVVVAGRRIDASHGARLENGVVFAPLDPFVRDIAERIDGDGSGLRFVLRRGDRSITLVPRICDGEPYVALAATVRALGGSAEYVGRAHLLSIVFVPTPLVTMTPFAGYVAPPGPLPTFTAKPTDAPRPVVTGVPRPRRTPIVIDPS